MGDNNNGNNNDNWSNRNWQDARSFGSTGPNGGNNESMFDSIFKSGRGGVFGGNGPEQNRGGFFTMPGNNGKIGGNWLRGRNSLGVIVIVLVIIIIFTFYTQFSMNEGITKSTIQRAKIESSFDYANDNCFTDMGTTVEDESPLRNSFKTFHNKTGVVPYIYILPAGGAAQDMEALADEKYAELISGDNHFFVLLQPKGGYECSFTYRLGENAKKVMDDEALKIFSDYLNKFYSARQTDNQTYLVSTYGYTADRIMSTSNVDVKSLVFGIIVIVVLVCVIIYWIRKKKRESENEKGPDKQRIEQDMGRRR